VKFQSSKINMKHLKQTIIIVLISIIQIQAIFAQEDSVTVESSIESIDESDFNKKQEYKYIDVNFIKEKTLFKLGFSPLDYINVSLEDFTIENINTTISIEQKIIPSLSLITDNHFGYHKKEDLKLWWYSFNIGIRFYYLMNRRIKKSTGVNNFHSNYFSFKLENCATYYYRGRNYYNYGYEIDPTFWGGNWSFTPLVKFSWGMQRRLGRWGFIDAGTYLAYQEFTLDGIETNSYRFGLNLSLGFGLGL